MANWLMCDRWLVSACALVFSLAILPGCQGALTKNAPELAQPEARPVSNITSFSESLRCMDDLFLAFGVNNVVITSQGIPDATGEIQTGTKEMMISAISKMSLKSTAFRFVDFDQSQYDINALHDLAGFSNDFIVPDYYIRGAITQFDEGVLSRNVSGGFSLPVPLAMMDASMNQSVSVVSVDLNVGDLRTRQIIIGTSANNSIAVSRSGQSANAEGTIESNDLGLNFNISLNRSEGMHQSIRTLVELSSIETLGKLSKVPYWRCLGVGQADPKMIALVYRWFMAMSKQERVAFVQRTLGTRGLYNGPDDGSLNLALNKAIGLYQESHGLLADGRIDFDLYVSLIDGDLAQWRAQNKRVRRSSFKPRLQQPKEILRFLVTPDKGQQSTYKIGETFTFTLHPSTDAFAYCYYKDSTNNVVQVFPNRFQPNALVPGGSKVRVPGIGSHFEIVMEALGEQEEVLCLASNLELGLKLPDHLKTVDLTPLQVRSLDEVAQSFRRISQGQVIEKRLPIRVVQ